MSALALIARTIKSHASSSASSAQLTCQVTLTQHELIELYIQVTDVGRQREARSSIVHVNYIYSRATVFFTAATEGDEGEHWQGQITCKMD